MGATRGLNDAIAITGIGESAYTEGGGNDVGDLVYDACLAAIRDAGLKPSEVDGIVTERDMMPMTVSPTDISEELGTRLEFNASCGRAGAGTVAAPLIAAQAIQYGLAEHVICYFGLDWATQREEKGSVEGGPYSHHLKDPYKANLEVPFGFAAQPLYLAIRARRHMHEFGTTNEQLGQIAVQQRMNATENSKAVKREPMTIEDYFDSPVIADPFRVLDCCLITDGAAAYVMSSAETATDHQPDPAYVRGIGHGFGAKGKQTTVTQLEDYTTLPSEYSAPKAYEMAEVGPEDMDFAEIYDCFTITTLIQLEDLGFCEKGDGGRFVAQEGITVEDGVLPVNTHGGLLSQAYVLGINHVVEAVRQIRGDADNQVQGADTGLVAGWGAGEHVTLVLGGDRE